jgi:uncharacterized protein (DUF1697 family)
MAVFVALLRAVNVGGTGMLAMKDLVGLCEDAGFTRVSTYIQSGNVVFESRLGEAQVKARLEKALDTHMGKPVTVMIRSGSELGSVLERNPFPKAPPNKVAVLFLDDAPPRNALAGLVIPGREEVRLSEREVFVHYPEGMGRSKLKLPFAATATARNINTVARLSAMARERA